jgi:arginase
MSRTITKFRNFLGQSKKGVYFAPDRMFKKEKSIKSKIGTYLDSTLNNLYHTRNSIDKEQKKITIIKCRNFFGQSKKGVYFAPDLMFKKEQSIESKIGTDLDSTLNNLYHTHNNLNKEQKRITIGGDHSTSIASIAWTLNNYPNAKVLWIDAHADINTRTTSPSNNIHGMPLAYLSGIEYSSNWKFIKNKLNLKNLMYVGIRDLDPFEKDILDNHQIQRVNVSEFNNNKFNKIINFLGDSTYHLSLDIDSIDPSFIPCTGTPSNNGLNINTFLDFIKVLNFKNMINMDIVEINLYIGTEVDKTTSLNNIKLIEKEFLQNKSIF